MQYTWIYAQILYIVLEVVHRSIIIQLYMSVPINSSNRYLFDLVQLNECQWNWGVVILISASSRADKLCYFRMRWTHKMSDICSRYKRRRTCSFSGIKSLFCILVTALENIGLLSMLLLFTTLSFMSYIPHCSVRIAKMSSLIFILMIQYTTNIRCVSEFNKRPNWAFMFANLGNFTIIKYVF